MALTAKTQLLCTGFSPNVASPGCCGFCTSSEKIQQSPLWHKCTYAGQGVSGETKPILEIQGAYREPWAGVKKSSVFLVPGSLSSCANVFSWVSHDDFSVVTTDLNTVWFHV